MLQVCRQSRASNRYAVGIMEIVDTEAMLISFMLISSAGHETCWALMAASSLSTETNKKTHCD